MKLIGCVLSFLVFACASDADQPARATGKYDLQMEIVGHDGYCGELLPEHAVGKVRVYPRMDIENGAHYFRFEYAYSEGGLVRMLNMPAVTFDGDSFEGEAVAANFHRAERISVRGAFSGGEMRFDFTQKYAEVGKFGEDGHLPPCTVSWTAEAVRVVGGFEAIATLSDQDCLETTPPIVRGFLLEVEDNEDLGEGWYKVRFMSGSWLAYFDYAYLDGENLHATRTIDNPYQEEKHILDGTFDGESFEGELVQDFGESPSGGAIKLSACFIKWDISAESLDGADLP